jgi:ribonuclease VapC
LTGAPSSVIDSSALLALLNNEPGGNVVAPLLADAAMSAVNWSEVVQKALVHGVAATPESLRADVESLGLELRPFTTSQAEAAAKLWSSTRHVGLALGDRACLSLALELGATVITADRAWAQLRLAAPVHVVR